MRRSLIPAALLCAASPLNAQSADKPLGEILEAIEEPAPPPPRTPVPSSGIGTTTLPPSQVLDAFEPPADAGDEKPLWESDEAERQAQWEAAERARIEALDRARAEREATVRRAHEESVADYERRLAERDAAIAKAQADYQAELERARRDRALWEARVRACNAGDRSQCAQPGDY